MIRVKRSADPWGRLGHALSVVALSVVLGCATPAPYVGQGPHPQLERGQPCAPVDVLGNFLAIPWKLIFWDWRFANHAISPATETMVVRYLEERGQDLSHVRVRLNQYAPHKDLKRLITNHRVGWPYRLVFGSLAALTEFVAPGRLFSLLISDYYNPWTDTVHIYSDHPAIALHELGHAYDFSQQPYRGTYALLGGFFIVRLHEEWRATDEALSYLVEVGDRRNELRAYKILYPAFGSYLGSYLIPIPFGNVPGILIGHIPGRLKATARARFYQELDTQTTPPTPRSLP